MTERYIEMINHVATALGEQLIDQVVFVGGGRTELVAEVKAAKQEIKAFISEELSKLLDHQMIDHVIQSQVRGDEGRADLLFERITDLITLA